MILSTEDHSELMQKIATQTAARFSLLPDVPSNDVNDGVIQKEIQFSDKVKGVYSFYRCVISWGKTARNRNEVNQLILSHYFSS